jgi:hypothetical protein
MLEVGAVMLPPVVPEVVLRLKRLDPRDVCQVVQFDVVAVNFHIHIAGAAFNPCPTE